jgi:UDP-glucose 4-epimerase
MDNSNGRDKILVAGCCGNLGSQVSRSLVRQGKRVVGIDNISKDSVSPVEDLYNLNNFEFIRGDIASLSIPAGVGCILFLAKPDKRDHAECISVNVDGLYNCLAYCEENEANILYASTPISLSPIDPSQLSNTFYVSRYLGESMVRSFHDSTGLGSIVLRMPSVHGGSTSSDQIVNRFIREAVEKGTVSVFKDPNSARSYIHSEDATASICEAQELLFDNRFRTIDLNGSEVLTAGDIAKKIQKYMAQSGDEPAILWRSRRYGHRRAVVSRAVSPLTTQPRIKIDSCLDGLFRKIKDELR